jgi:DNA-binding NtrC family response regulator
VLISGGPGVGKRLLAQWIHAQSPQSRGPCIELECRGSASEALLAQTSAGGGGTPRGTQSDVASALEHAEGGSLIVRHVEDAAPALQDQLLRLAEPDGRRAGRDLARAPSDVRLLFTACTELKSRAESGTFRKDLYYAIKGLSLHIPDLRERSADIVPLARHFLREAAERLGAGTPTLDREAIAAAVRYPWPGNVAELERLMNRLAAQAVNGRILASDFPAVSSAPLAPNGRAAILSLRDALAEPERQTIERALRLNDWNRNQTAAMLKVNRSTLFNKMKKYGLLAPGDRA